MKKMRTITATIKTTDNVTESTKLANRVNLKRGALALTLATLAMTAGAQTVDNLNFGPRQEQRGKEIDGIAVIVGNDVITQSEMRAIGDNRAKLEGLILRKLLLQTAKRHNITAGDTALNIALDKVKKGGKSISRQQLREEMLIQKLQQQVVNSFVKISDQEVNTAVERQLKNVDERLRLIDILVRVPDAANTEALNQAQEVVQRMMTQLKTQPEQAVAQSNGAVLSDLGWVPLSKIPPHFASVLIDAPTGKFLPPIIDSDGVHLLKVLERQAASNVNLDVKGPTETRASHILIKSETPNAKGMIDDIYRQLQSGADFATLTKQYSQDQGSAANGGALGGVLPGQMVPDFEAVMNQTGIGQISRPFKSKFGYHIVKVYERRQAKAKSTRDAIEQQVRQAIFRKKAAEEWDIWLSQLRDEATIEFIK
ncbi:MAG: hypothetical protein CR974_02610 [Gammaproteobacteria bacterium]|nr:MAG: hypothetical protein CR974_02610 [Gammaproteobacteria bacterium]